MSCASLVAVIEAMADAGATPQMMAVAARKIAQQDEERRAEVREQARLRQQRKRQREREQARQTIDAETNASRVTQRDARDGQEPLPPFSPLLPSPKPLTNNPPIIPPSSEKPAREIAKREPNGSRLAADWTLPEDWGEEARRIAFKAKQPISDDEISNEADKFRDYWHGKPGAAGRKCNWRSTWANWVRSYLERRSKARNAPGGYRPHANGEHRSSTIEDAAIRRALQRQNGNGVPNQGGRGHDIPPAPDLIDGEFRLVS